MRHLSLCPFWIVWQAAAVGRFHQPDRLRLAEEELIAVGPEQPSTSINKTSFWLCAVGGWVKHWEGGIPERAWDGGEMWGGSDILWHIGPITFKTKHWCWTPACCGHAWASPSTRHPDRQITELRPQRHRWKIVRVASSPRDVFPFFNHLSKPVECVLESCGSLFSLKFQIKKTTMTCCLVSLLQLQ